jgi:RNA polymerase sigma-70 factor (ECF subfamily)
MADASHRSPMHGLSISIERDAVQRAARGDQQAVGQLYDAYVEPLFRFCVARVGNETDAEDLTEEIFLKVIRSIDGFEWRPLARIASADGTEQEERSPFRAWLFRIARNHVISHYRRQNTRKSEGEVPEWIPDEALGPAELTERSVTIDELFRVVEALPAAQREVIQLRFGAGLSIAETAEALDKQQTNVKVLQHKGIKRLKELLEAAEVAQEEKRNDEGRRYRRLDR